MRTFLVIALLALLLAFSGCSDDHSQAGQLVKDSDALRSSAVDTLRRSTATIDGLVRDASAGRALPASQTKASTTKVVEDLNTALADLTSRDDKLKTADGLQLNDNYHKYISQLRTSNDLLTATINTASEIPRLIEREQYSLAGWDEIKAQQIVSQIMSIDQQINKMYTESEMMRNQAEQIRKDNPEDFED
ncbi:MAG: hypothetical protein WC935_08495 [Thermoleophilia bacterium]